MFHAKVNELRRVGDRAVANSCVAHGKDTKFGRHAVEISHALGDLVIREYPTERRGDGDPRRWFVGHRCRIRVQQDSRMDGSCRNRRRNAISSIVAACPIVPSSSCASISLVPVRKPPFCRAANPVSTLEAISHDRGVGHALMTDVASEVVQEGRLEAQKRNNLWPDAGFHPDFDQSSKSGSRSRWTKRLRSGRGMEKCTRRSEAGLPAAITTQPSGRQYSPSLRSSTS